MISIKKGTSLLISGIMAFSVLFSAFAVANAEDNITGLEPGTYTVPIVSLESAAPLPAVQEAFNKAFGEEVTVTVENDGSAVITAKNNHMSIDFSPMGTFDANVAWIEGATVISTYETVYTNTHQNLVDTSVHTQDAITVPSEFSVPYALDENGSQRLTIGVDFMAAMFGQDVNEYSTNVTLTLDMSGAEPVNGAFSFGSAGIELEPGVYSIPVSMKNASNLEIDSMAASCIVGGRVIVGEDGSAKMTIYLQPVSAFGFTLAASDWKVYQTADMNGEPVTAEYTLNGKSEVDSITFDIPNNAWDGIYVNMYIGGIMNVRQNAYFKLDYTDAASVEEQTPVEGETVTVEIPDTAENSDAKAMIFEAEDLVDPYWSITVKKDEQMQTETKELSTKVISGKAVIGLVLYNFGDMELVSAELKGAVIE